MFSKTNYLADAPNAAISLIESAHQTTIDEEWDCDICDAIGATEEYFRVNHVNWPLKAVETRQELLEQMTFAWNEEGDIDEFIAALEDFYRI